MEARTTFGFDTAIIYLKKGRRIARTGWNGKDMWIALTPGSSFAAAVAKEGHAAFYRAEEMNPHDSIHLAPHIDMRAADGTMVIGWVASQTDLLAEDWFLVGAPNGFDIAAFRKAVRAVWKSGKEPEPGMARYVSVSSEEYDLFFASLPPSERFIRGSLDRAGVTHVMLDRIPVSPNPTMPVGAVELVQVGV